MSDHDFTIKQLLHTVERLEAVRVAAESVLECIDIDGAMIHSEACGCDGCEAIRGLRAALKGTT